MDKVSAACAMGWSIQLEKGLRSKRPGDPIESIQKMGPRLNQWSMEPQLTVPVYSMFGLVPGEDRLFSDAIFLRFADAFVAGDNVTRLAIIKVFLSTLRHCKTKEAREHRIFSNMSMETRLELLRRVKVLLSAECVESRALTFILFGCWADITKDIAEIRHAILSNMFSSHVLEVKALLSAAGCFSEVSDDFGSVFLERLLNLMNSPKTSPVLKIAGAQALSKINCSVLLAIKSYKAGAELARKFSKEDIMGAMLITLTKLSSKAVILIPEQVGLLSLFLTQEASLNVQATVLRCILYLAKRTTGFLPISTFAFHTLFKMLDEPSTASPLRCNVLRIIFEIISYGLPNTQLTDVNELVKLSRCIENATQSSFLSERLLAFEVLVCISNKVKGKPELMFDSNYVAFPSAIVVALSDQITRLICPVSDGIGSSEFEQELRSMLVFLLVLVENHSELSYLILGKLHSIIENVVNSHNMTAATLQNYAVHKVVNDTADGNLSMRTFMLHVHRFLVVFLKVLDEAGAGTDEVACKLNDLVVLVCGSSLFDCSIHTFYALLLHSHVNWCSLFSKDKNTGDSDQGISESRIHECAGNMLAGGDCWNAYKAGKFAACKGVWYVANMIFQHLETRGQSQICCQWLKFLAQFTHFETNTQMLLQQAGWSWPPENNHVDVILSEYVEKFHKICDGISSSGKVLEAISVQTQTLYFQRWLLALRVRVLLVLADILKLLANIRQPGENDGNDGNPLFQKIKGMDGVSSTLTMLAEECDLIASSFIDMDSTSFEVISSLAFSCSLLGFCIEFTNLNVRPLDFKNPTENFGDYRYVLVHKLAKQLWCTDSETCMDLMSLLKEYGVDESSLHLLPRFRFTKVGRIPEDVLTVCKYCVKEMVQVRNEPLGVHNKDTTLNAMLLLLRTITTWMRIPFQIPKYFFQVRPNMGSMLIFSSASGRKQSVLLASPGCPLALNLCIQLENIPSDISSFSKIYCILYCKTSFSANKLLSPCGEMQTGYQPSKTQMIIDMNKKLQCLVMKQAGEFSNCCNLQSDDETEAYVCFETKGRSQAFTTCLLDVSAFPIGSYRIHWHSGFVDSCGAFWSLLPLSPGPVFSVGDSPSHR